MMNTLRVAVDVGSRFHQVAIGEGAGQARVDVGEHPAAFCSLLPPLRIYRLIAVGSA